MTVTREGEFGELMEVVIPGLRNAWLLAQMIVRHKKSGKTWLFYGDKWCRKRDTVIPAERT